MVALFAPHDGQLTMVTAVVIVLLVDESASIMSWLSRSFCGLSREISFALYLVHFTIMASLSCFIFLSIYRSTGAYVLSSRSQPSPASPSLSTRRFGSSATSMPQLFYSPTPSLPLCMRCLPRLAIGGIADDGSPNQKELTERDRHPPPQIYLGPSISHNNHGRPRNKGERKREIARPGSNKCGHVLHALG